jgi:hypothetical protein
MICSRGFIVNAIIVNASGSALINEVRGILKRNIAPYRQINDHLKPVSCSRPLNSVLRGLSLAFHIQQEGSSPEKQNWIPESHMPNNSFSKFKGIVLSTLSNDHSRSISYIRPLNSVLKGLSLPFMLFRPDTENK